MHPEPSPRFWGGRRPWHCRGIAPTSDPSSHGFSLWVSALLMRTAVVGLRATLAPHSRIKSQSEVPGANFRGHW